MTVTSTTYCTIDEAWGDLTGGKKKDSKRRKQPVQDPICDLYESRANTSAYAAETDLVRFANDYYNRSANGQENNVRETSPKNVKINATDSMYDLSIANTNANKSAFEKQFEVKLPPMYDVKDEMDMEQEEDEVIIKPQMRYPQQLTQPHQSSPHIDTFNNYDNYDESHNYQEMKRYNSSRYSSMQILDLVLYVVSGIILIFLLEQFVKIGIHLQH
jgi:hypothetical protein